MIPAGEQQSSQLLKKKKKRKENLQKNSGLCGIRTNASQLSYEVTH